MYIHVCLTFYYPVGSKVTPNLPIDRITIYRLTKFPCTDIPTDRKSITSYKSRFEKYYAFDFNG